MNIALSATNDASGPPAPTDSDGKDMEVDDDNVEDEDDRAILNSINAPVARTLKPPGPVNYIKDNFMWLRSGITALILVTKVHLITYGDFREH